ncbi:hypothetical protein CBS101457_000759 [Exobasidium rhododendri]|nr:hypothetical protein CBS101457_000759 [Exobasidium rhododendri]
MTTPTTPATAWRYHKRGLLPTILKKEEVEVRDLKSDEVLIKVHAAALNPVDWKIASLMPGFVNKLPHTAAADFAGEIVRFNTGVQSQQKDWIKASTRVYGIVPADETMKTGEGSLSTHLIAKCSNIAPIPENMSYEDASGLALVGLTAASLGAGVKKGDRVLILGGTTAVGLLLIQMCIAVGVSYVAATASTDKMKIVEELGAHKVFDYRKSDVEATLKTEFSSEPFDYVLDCVGNFETFRASPGFLKQTGQFINVGASGLDLTRLVPSVLEFAKGVITTLLLPVWLGGTPRKYVLASLDLKHMDKLSDYVSSGKVRPRVDTVFRWEEAPKAYEYLIKGRATGKVVVKVGSS